MNQHVYDVLIIGGGPGGVQTALTYKEICEENNIKPNMVVLEASKKVGNSFTKFPVHGKLISNNKLYTGKPFKSRFSERFDWNSLITKDKNILMRNYSSEFYPKSKYIVEMLNDLVNKYQLPIHTQTKWIGTRKTNDGLFEVETNQGTYISRHVVVATGLTPTPPKIPGSKHITMYENMLPKEYYRDKRVLILGKGNSATECAQDILNEASVIMLASPNSAKLALDTHYVGNIRATNSILAENYQLKHQAALLDCNVKNIEKVEGGFQVTVEYLHANGEVETLFFNEVVAATGFHSNLETLMGDFEIKWLHNKFPSINGRFESTEIENLYFAGAQTHGLDYRMTSTSGFIHGFRYNAKILAHLLAEKSGVIKTRSELIKTDIIDYILEEFNESPDMWLQPGYVGALLQFENEEWRTLGYRTIHEFNQLSSENSSLVMLTLEYGDIHQFKDTFNVPRTPGDADKSVHIHPVIRVKENGEIKMYNLEEHLESRFSHETYAPEIRNILNTIKTTHLV